jgi:hypothetical protein
MDKKAEIWAGAISRWRIERLPMSANTLESQIYRQLSVTRDLSVYAGDILPKICA